MEKKIKLEEEKFEELKEDLAFTELEERLEMVQLAALSQAEAEAAEKRCNGSC